MRELYRSHDGIGLAGLVQSGEVTALELLEPALAIAEEHNDLLNAITVWDVERARETAAGFLDGPGGAVPPQGPVLTHGGTRLHGRNEALCRGTPHVRTRGA